MAIKVHREEAGYLRERDAYLRLRALGTTTIRGCNVPELLAHHDALWILVMTVVVRPFVLDFGGAYLDQAPDFSDDVMADWRLANLVHTTRKVIQKSEPIDASEALGRTVSKV